MHGVLSATNELTARPSLSKVALRARFFRLIPPAAALEDPNKGAECCRMTPIVDRLLNLRFFPLTVLLPRRSSFEKAAFIEPSATLGRIADREEMLA